MIESSVKQKIEGFWKKSVVILACMFCMGITSSFGQGNAIEPEVFISPVDHKIKLSGSFGELRSNHFHAGIDIKSKTGEEGDTVRATLSGFVSRIKIQRGGYGQVVYMDHPSGYTSVYAHLREFAPKLQEFISDQQYENKSYEIDIYPEKNRFSFTQGESIGLMGNTGRSYGPHLHFEIRKTDNEVPENPYLHNIGPEDNQPPLLYAVEAHGLDNEHHKIWSKSQAVNQKNGNLQPVTFSIPAWRAGMAVQTFDLMDGASNKNGIYSIQMLVDDSIHYSHIMDRVGFDVSKYINSHIDYGEKKKNNRTLTKCYVSPGNKLSFYPDLVNFGEIKLFKEKARKVEFVIKDFLENETTYTCFLKRREAKEGEIKQNSFQKYLIQGESAEVKMGSCRFYFPSNTFDKNTYIEYEELEINNKIAFKINDETTPLFSYPAVSIPLTGVDSNYYDKVVLVEKGKTSYGGHVENDSLRARIGMFGEFSVAIDTIPPTIEVGSFLSKAKGKPYFRFAFRDNYEVKGYANNVKYDVFIDGEWVIATLKAIGNVLIVPLDDVPSGNHRIKIRVEDHSSNVSVWERDFSN